MDRRTFMGRVAVGILAAPLTVRAQLPGKLYRIGLLFDVPPGPPGPIQKAMREGLRDLGWVEGQTYVMETRFANFDPSAMRTLAAELVAQPVDVIVVNVDAVAFAAKEATKDIPIVVVFAHNAVGTGLVAGLSRPGANITGLDTLAPGLDAKRLELLKQILPHTARVAVLCNPLDRSLRLHLDGIKSASETLGLKIRVFEVRQPADFERAFEALAQEHPDALIVVTDGMMYFHRKRIIALADQQRLPGVFEFQEFAHAGGLLSYGPDLSKIARRAAYYVDKILKGAKPADLPVEQPTEFQLVINAKTAKELGVTIPQSLLLRADEVIQ